VGHPGAAKMRHQISQLLDRRVAGVLSSRRTRRASRGVTHESRSKESPAISW
jgi:hypothetical protein